MKLLYVAAAFVLACVALSALAQTESTPRIDKRQANQERRIEQGQKKGQLTEKEAEDPDGYASRVSSTTAIRTPTTPVTAAARGPAAILATATKAVTIAAAARRTTIGEPTWAGPETM